MNLLKKSMLTVVPGVKKKLLFLPKRGVSKIPQLITRRAFCSLILIYKNNTFKYFFIFYMSIILLFYKNLYTNDFFINFCITTEDFLWDFP